VIQKERTFDAVCFDCDSTLSSIEGIDELASRAGLESQIAPLTAAAMEGTLTLDAVYAKRLSLVRPDRAALAWLGKRYVDELVPGAKETVDILHRTGKAVYIVSGGLLPAIAQLAQALTIPHNRTIAVDVLFASDGSYLDFDRQSPLTRSDGKAVVCQSLANTHRSIAMVGDGVTDLAARTGGAYIVGFGGVVQRPAVVNGADAFVPGPNLTAVLDALFTKAERKLAGLQR
jgi:phosphoserine phosphatase